MSTSKTSSTDDTANSNPASHKPASSLQPKPAPTSSSTTEKLKCEHKKFASKSKAVYMNIQGLLPCKNYSKIVYSRRKLDYLNEYVLKENIKMIFLTETHLNPDIEDDEVQIANFKIFRSDRTKRKCGGVCIYVHNDINMPKTDIFTFSNSTCETVIIFIEELELHAICSYRPPDSTSEKFKMCLKEINLYLEKVPSSHSIILAGDMNFPFVKWSEIEESVIHLMKSGATKDEQCQFEALTNLTDDYLLQQVISEPTRKDNFFRLNLH